MKPLATAIAFLATLGQLACFNYVDRRGANQSEDLASADELTCPGRDGFASYCWGNRNRDGGIWQYSCTPTSGCAPWSLDKQTGALVVDATQAGEFSDAMASQAQTGPFGTCNTYKEVWVDISMSDTLSIKDSMGKPIKRTLIIDLNYKDSVALVNIYRSESFLNGTLSRQIIDTSALKSPLQLVLRLETMGSSGKAKASGILSIDQISVHAACN